MVRTHSLITPNHRIKFYRKSKQLFVSVIKRLRLPKGIENGWIDDFLVITLQLEASTLITTLT